MVSTVGGAFGFTSGTIVQEFGYDDDVDPALREAAETLTGTELVDEDYEDVADSAIVWWRADDGDVDDLPTCWWTPRPTWTVTASSGY